MARKSEDATPVIGEGAAGATTARIELIVDPAMLVPIDWSVRGASLDRVSAKNIITRQIGAALDRAANQVTRQVIAAWDADNPGSEPTGAPVASGTVPVKGTYTKSAR